MPFNLVVSTAFAGPLSLPFEQHGPRSLHTEEPFLSKRFSVSFFPKAQESFLLSWIINLGLVALPTLFSEEE